MCFWRFDVGSVGGGMGRRVWGCALPLWLGILLRVARGDGGRVVMPLFHACFSGISLGCALGGEVWGLVGEVGVIGTSRNFGAVNLPSCSF
jgi:hypothetical protein